MVWNTRTPRLKLSITQVTSVKDVGIMKLTLSYKKMAPISVRDVVRLLNNEREDYQRP